MFGNDGGHVSVKRILNAQKYDRMIAKIDRMRSILHDQ